MHIKQVELKNFRLLKNVCLALDERATVVVGRNNSGKTSLAELFRRVLTDKPVFRLEDFSLSACQSLWDACKARIDGADEAAVDELIPTIEIRIVFTYPPDAADLGPLSEFVVDLDPDTTEAVAVIRYALPAGRLEGLFAGFDEDFVAATPPDVEQFFGKLRERVPRLFKANLFAVDPNDATNELPLDWSQLHRVLQCGFVNAQRGLDDMTSRDKDVLGKVIEALFITAMEDSASEEDHKAAKTLSDAVEEMQGGISKEFRGYLETVNEALTLLGYPGLGDPGLGIEVTLDPQRLLQNHTHVRYSGANGLTLPESYNGLGSRNLILILLQLLQFFRAYEAREVSPVAHLVFIEEPEAHLHPQMQQVFIRTLSKVADFFAEKYSGGKPWPVQFVVSTHSPHLANEASFDATRYFMVSGSPDGLRTTVVKDLSLGLGGQVAADREFLHKYMTLTRCDLLFADKAVLIEGPTERLILPRMIEKCDEELEGGTALGSQYLSVMEVGGAYAHVFFPLLDFLELRTLIITDIDSVGLDQKKCVVSAGTATSNSCIRNWFGGAQVSPADLLGKTPGEKAGPSRRIAYQVPHAPGGACGRSFEDAFMLANPDEFGLGGLTAADAEARAYTKAQAVDKTDFGLKYAIEQTDWTTPRYIAEGLSWLAEERGAEPVAEVLAAAVVGDVEPHDGSESE